MRKLVTIRKIAEVLPIEGADAIELVKIDGWQCVSKKGEFAPGDLCVYFEIDSYLPIRPEYEHIRARTYKKMGDQEGLRIKTIKLRGQISQGLALPINILGKPEETFPINEDSIGADVTEFLGVQKYEPPVPTQLAGQVSGNFPGFIKKTDQERCQNLGRDIFVENEDSRYEITIKLDGTSFTAYNYNGKSGVCSRNWELKLDGSNEGNTLVRMYVDSNIGTALAEIGLNYAVQGELMGPGIQKNREGLKETKLFVFDIYDIDNSRYLSPNERHEVLDRLYRLGLNRQLVEHTPVIAMDMSLEDLEIFGIDQLLIFAEGPSIVHPIREGLVFKRIDGGFSFKVISNKFLLKEED